LSIPKDKQAEKIPGKCIAKEDLIRKAEARKATQKRESGNL